MPKYLPQDIWVIIPSYNESAYLPKLLPRVKNIGLPFIVVDDGSKDHSSQIASKWTPYALRHLVNLGKGAALKTGCEYAFGQRGAKAVIFMDADNQHDPAELALFVNALKAGNDVVFGVRDHSNMPFYKSFFNTFASSVIFLLFGRVIPDIPSGYKALTKNAYNTLKWESTGYEVEVEIAVRVAKEKLSFQAVKISTIYHDLSKGLTMLDVLGMFSHIISWRMSL